MPCGSKRGRIPLKIGYTVIVNIDVRVNPPAIESVAARLAAFPEIYFLGVCTGGSIYTPARRSGQTSICTSSPRSGYPKVPGIANTSMSVVMRVVIHGASKPLQCG